MVMDIISTPLARCQGVQDKTIWPFEKSSDPIVKSIYDHLCLANSQSSTSNHQHSNSYKVPVHHLTSYDSNQWKTI